jgi:hypothetical protein
MSIEQPGSPGTPCRHRFVLVGAVAGAGLLEAQENAAVEDGRRMDEEALFINASYGRSSPYGHRIDLLTVGPSTGRYMVEYHLLPLVIARRDPFGNKTAVSQAPLYQLILPLLIAGEIDIYGEKDNRANRIVRPLLYLNARHHAILWSKDQRRLRILPVGLFSPVYMISLFYKHNTDIFVGHNRWMNWSPGIGLNLMGRGVQIQAGYNINIEFDRHRAQKRRWPYVMVGLTAAVL